MNHRLSYSMKLARPVVALAAAYAVALQILLASVMAAGMAMAPAADGFICYSSGNTSDSGNQRPSHAPGLADCALACAQGLSAGAILPPDILPALASAMGRPLVQAAVTDVILSPCLSPKLAQGPPQNA